MRLHFPLVLALVSVSSISSISSTAAADTLTSSSDSYGVITTVGRGVKELGAGSLLVVGYDKTGDTSGFRAVGLAGGTFRYFIANNIALSLEANFLYRQAGTGPTGQVDLGGLALLSAGYYASLGGGLFLVPQLGAGGLYGKRTIGEDPAAVRAKLVGFNGELGLALAFYPSAHFSVRAGPDALLTIGNATTTDVAALSSSLTSVDAGFKVGISYVF